METRWLALLLLLLPACAPQHALIVESACLMPYTDYVPITTLSFASRGSGDVPLQVVVDGSCESFDYSASQEGAEVHVDLTSAPVAGCVDTCTNGTQGLAGRPRSIINVPLDFTKYLHAQEVVVRRDGDIIERIPIKGASCSKGSCPRGYACVDDPIVPGPDGACMPADCGSASAGAAAQCAEGYSCILEAPGAAGSCVKDIPVDYCERDEDCVRQGSACDCGYGTWVNRRFFAPAPEDAPRCACAFRDARGACKENHCVGVPDQMREPAAG